MVGAVGASGSGVADDPLGNATAFSLLAPSPRNSSPWIITRPEPDTMVISLDRRQVRPVSDPEGREVVISCGVALRYIQLALAASGVAYAVTFPVDRYATDRIATIRLTGDISHPDEVAQQLVLAAAERHTNWGPFLPDPVTETDIEVMQTAVEAEGAEFTLVRSPSRAQVNLLIERANRELQEDPRFAQEVHNWPMGRPARTSPYSTRSPSADSAGSLIVISTPQDEIASWLSAGRALGHMLLVAAGLGLSCTFMNQPLQVWHYRESIGAIPGVRGYPQQLVRVGTPIKSAQSPPRRPVEDITRPPVEPW